MPRDDMEEYDALARTRAEYERADAKEEMREYEREVQELYDALEADLPYDTALDLVVRAMCHLTASIQDMPNTHINKPFKATDMARSLQCIVGEMYSILRIDQRDEPKDIVVELPGGGTITTQAVSAPYQTANGLDMQMTTKAYMEIQDIIVGWLPCTHIDNKYKVCEPIIADIIKTAIIMDCGGWGVSESWWGRRAGDATRE